MERETRSVSAQNLLFSQAIAERLGINNTDLECLDLVRSRPDETVTAGDLVTATGLTSGAITGVIDRLERAGLVRRERDPADRRKVVVRATQSAEKAISPLFAPLHCSMNELWASYSDEQLTLLRDFLTRACNILKAEVMALTMLPIRRGKRAAAKKKETV